MRLRMRRPAVITAKAQNPANDQDRVTKFTYNELGLLKEQIALDANTAQNQTTRYVYAFDLGDAGCTIARPELLRAVIFPDSTDTYTDNGVGSRSISGTDHVTYTYYCNGARKTATDQRGVVHTYTYDDMGRLTLDAATTIPPGQTYAVDEAVRSIGRTYDANGAAASVTSYDNTTGGGGHEVNQIVYARDGWGNITRSTQDPNGPAGGTDPNVGYQWGYGLDGDAAKYARLEKIALPGGRGIYYNYESDTNFQFLGRGANIAANGSPTEAQKYVSYTYLGASTVVEANHPAVTGGLRLTYDAGATGHYPGFDRFGRVLWQTWLRSDGSTAADRYFYGYDRAGNRTWRAERANAGTAGGRDEAYVYDGLDRLVGAKRGILPYTPYQAPCPGDVNTDGFVDGTDKNLIIVNWDPTGQYGRTWTQGELNGDGYVDGADRTMVINNWAPGGVTENVAKSWSWTLDPRGNWPTYKYDSNGDGDYNDPNDLDQSRGHNQGNEITSISGLSSPLHDPAGNMVFGPRPADPNAAPAHYRYDAWNRLATVHLDNGDTSGTLDPNDSLLATYRYDGLSRRVKTVTAVDGNSVIEYVFHNESWQVVEIRRGVNAEPGSAGYKQYAWDIRYIDAPVCRWWDADADGTMEPASGEMHYFTNDGNFNTTALVDGSTGTVVERYLYDPYGRPTFLSGSWGSRSASAYDNEILYCGYRHDVATGLYQVRNRYYNWLTGRWMTTDPIGYADGMSLYQYCHGSPATQLDTSGLKDYKVGTDDPKVTYDPDCGAFASKEWTWKWWYLKMIILSNLYHVESILPDATAAMRHYFDASGRTYTINLAGMVREVPSARINYNAELAEAMKFAGTLDLGEHQITSGSITDGYNRQAESQNWYLTTGGHSVWGKGKVTVSCPNGKKKYRLVFIYEFRDRYNWDEDKSVTIGPVTIYDAWMLEFHLQGLAQHFNMKGSTMAIYEWEESKPPTPEPTPITVPSSGSGAGRGGRETGL